MNDKIKTKEELIKELHKLHKEYDLLKKSYSKGILERKGTEKALGESDEKFRSIMENSADAIFITNQQGKCTYTNKAVSVMLGYKSEEMLSKTITDFSRPNKIEEYSKFLNKVLSEGKGFTEIELLKKGR
jgi:PAS domain-containing protein